MNRLLTLLASLLVPMAVHAQTTPPPASDGCDGKFPNPITDVCWSCTLPITLFGGPMTTGGQEDIPSGYTDTFCACGNPPKVGLRTGFWEPARIFEAVRRPFCFPTLSGISINPGIDAPAHSQEIRKDGKAGHSFYHGHWYMNPLFFWLEVMMDNDCLEQGVFDVAYMTEIDPLWGDSELSFLLNADVVLFANPVAQAACTADCIAATAGFGISNLWWCSGCQGSTFPLTGWVQSRIGGVQASTLLMQRLTAKLHRQLMMWTGVGERGLCGLYPQAAMDKTHYKSQMLYPIPNTLKINGRCCSPYGRTTVITGAGKEFPVLGEDFSYQIFRKRDCCAGNVLNWFY